MGCILRISGKKLNVDKFDIGWKIKPSAIQRKGDLTFKKKKIESSQMVFDVSNADYNDLNGQIKDAIKFLKKNGKFLESVSTNKTVETFELDFSFNSRIDRKTVEVQHDYFSSELIKLAGNLNISIWLTQWPCETGN
jgi:hypothetical protein